MIISWNTTRACNLKCKHCYRDAGLKDPHELGLAEGRALLDEIKLAGFRIVVLSGGEPLLRKDIYELIEYGTSLGLRMVLGSNGTLISEAVATRLKKAGLCRAGVSLDSSDRAIHDEFRGVAGAYDQVFAGIENMRKTGLEFQVHTTVSKYNYHQIGSMIDFVSGLKASAYHIFFLVPSGRGRDQIEHLISPQEYYRLIDLILEKQKQSAMELKPVCAPQFMPRAQDKGMDMRFSRGCLAGTHYCCVLPNGDVHPCPYLPLLLGNVRQDRFSLIWKNNPVFRALRSLEYTGKCGQCPHKQICGGCRARAYYHSGEYMGEDYYCAVSDGRQR